MEGFLPSPNTSSESPDWFEQRMEGFWPDLTKNLLLIPAKPNSDTSFSHKGEGPISPKTAGRLLGYDTDTTTMQLATTLLPTDLWESIISWAATADCENSRVAGGVVIGVRERLNIVCGR